MPDFEELASEKPNIGALEGAGRWHDVVLAIEFRLQEGPDPEELLELELKAARVCADRLEDPGRAVHWLKRPRARDPGRALEHSEYRELCEQLGATHLLEPPPVEQPGLMGEGAQDAAVEPAVKELRLRLPAWEPFWRKSLLAGGIWTAAWLPVVLVVALANGCEGLSAAAWPLVTVQVALSLFIAGFYFYRYLWSASQRALEVDATEVILRDGRGRELLRERREQFSPVVGSLSESWSVLQEPEPALQIVGVGFRPITIRCAESSVRVHYLCEPVRGGVRYVLDRASWQRLIEALGLDTDPWGEPDVEK
ncbi:MAG: hypothetical protein ABI333_27125 [bacterium]